MWLWSRPWPYAWLWGSGSEFQKTASVTVYVTASVSTDGPQIVGEGISKQVNDTYYLSASATDYDATDIAFESAQIYYLSGSASYSVSASVTEAWYDLPVYAKVTANVSWALQQAGAFSKTPSGTYNVTASATPVVDTSAHASVDAYVTASITDVTVSIFYEYSLSATYNLTASADAALQIVAGYVTVTPSQIYYVTASVVPVLTINTNQRGKLVWSRKRGNYFYVATST